MSIGGHHSRGFANDQWLTPPDIVKALGEFDLDPCAADPMPWRIAKQSFNKFDNGLAREWPADWRVFLNPPYGEADRWLSRLAAHPGGGTALIFARTETELFFKHVWCKATSLLFIKGRLHFHHLNGARAKSNCGGPSVLVAYGSYDAKMLEQSRIEGHLLMIAPLIR